MTSIEENKDKLKNRLIDLFNIYHYKGLSKSDIEECAEFAEIHLEEEESIKKEEFERYEDVRVSGVTNMFMVTDVCNLSGLDIDKVTTIMKNYSELMKKYPEVRK